MFITTVGTSSFYIPICQKLVGLFVIILLRNLLVKLTLFVKIKKKPGGGFMMNFGGSPGIMIKVDPKFLKTLLHDMMVAVHNDLRGYPFFPGLNGNCHPIFI